MDTQFLCTGWILQALVYLLLLTRWRQSVPRWFVFISAVIAYIIAPAIIPFKGGFDPQTGEYVCGLAGFARTMKFWLFGNFVNLWLFLLSFLISPQTFKRI